MPMTSNFTPAGLPALNFSIMYCQLFSWLLPTGAIRPESGSIQAIFTTWPVERLRTAPWPAPRRSAARRSEGDADAGRRAGCLPIGLTGISWVSPGEVIRAEVNGCDRPEGYRDFPDGAAGEGRGGDADSSHRPAHDADRCRRVHSRRSPDEALLRLPSAHPVLRHLQVRRHAMPRPRRASRPSTSASPVSGGVVGADEAPVLLATLVVMVATLVQIGCCCSCARKQVDTDAVGHLRR